MALCLAVALLMRFLLYVRYMRSTHCAFVDLEKAFDRVPRDVIWWAMRKLGIDEWLMRLVQ